MAFTPYVGQIMQIAFDFAPKGWAMCEGQRMNIIDHPALFTVLGYHNTPGGGAGITETDKKTYFCLPDLRGRAAVHPNIKPLSKDTRLPEIGVGHAGGSSYTLLKLEHFPDHNHQIKVAASQKFDIIAENSMLGAAPIYTGDYLDEKSRHVTMHTNTVSGVSGHGGQIPLFHQSPYLGIYHCIALEGVYPTLPK